MARGARGVPARSPLAQLARRIETRTARIGVLGLGYVGLPLAVEFAREGYRVTGIDVDPQRVRAVTRGRSFVGDVPSEDVRRVRRARRLRATTSFGVLRSQDAIIICVPTPLRKTREPDMTYIVSATTQIAKALRKGQLVVLESTTYPGTTDEVVLPALESRGLKVGRDFCLAFSPERIDPGNPVYTTRSIPKVMGGVTPHCTKVAVALYSSVIDRLVPVSSTKTAEMVKLLENTFRAVNVGLVNEIALICHRLGINVWEVIEAARTKPFGFMPFYPGPGLGGHCLDGGERIVIKRNARIEMPTFEELFRRLEAEGTHRCRRYRGMTVMRPNDIEALSFDVEKRQVCFQPLQLLTARPYGGAMVDIRTREGRRLTVTDRHPLLVHNGALRIRWAKDLRAEDEPVVITAMPEGSCNARVDLLEHFRRDARYATPLRVVLRDGSWRTYRQWLRPILKRYRKDPWEYYRRNAVPLRAYLEAERLAGFPAIDHRQLMLSSGKGPSWSSCPVVIELDERFCRLVGYYLSEGCLTDDRSLRIRFSFHQQEREYLEDVSSILNRLGLRWSIYDSTEWRTSHIKVSSLPFGLLMRDVLQCGVDSYTMQVPPLIFGLSQRHRAALLAGLLRGDAGVEVAQALRTGEKNGRRYTYWGNHGSLNYYSVSPRLFQQVILLLHSQGILPTFKRRANLLTVFEAGQLRRCAEWLDGDKQRRLLKYLAARSKPMSSKRFRRHDGYASVGLGSLTTVNGSRTVYSAEVAHTQTFVTSYGIVVHNCIPSDPMYLAWKVRLHGYEARFIELASQINSAMPEYVVEKVSGVLNDRHQSLKGSRVLLLGCAYKKDVSDTRDSPAFEVARLLEERGARVEYTDPHVPVAMLNGKRHASRPLTPSRLRQADCVVLLTNHSAVDYARVLRHARVIVDTRNQFGTLTKPSPRVVTL